MRRAKSPRARLRDKMWALLYEAGFEHLNHPKDPEGKQPVLAIATKGGDAAAVAASAWARGRPDTKAMRELVTQLKALRDGIPRSLERKPCPTAVVLIVQHSPTEEEQRAAAAEGLALWDEEYLDYLLDMARQLGAVIRMQMLAPVLDDSTLDSLTVDAVRGKMKGQEYYVFSAKPADFLPLVVVRRYGDPALAKGHVLLGYQRVPMRKRLAKIREHVEEHGAFFPSAIVVSIDRGRGESLHFKSSTSRPEMGRLELPRRFASLSIIDGQHRLLGLYGTSASNRDSLPIVAFDALPPGVQSRLFVDINSRQKRVGANLLQSLYSGLNWESEHPQERLTAVLSRIVHTLDEDSRGPFFASISDATKRGEGRIITFTTIYEKLRRKGLVGSASDDEFSPGLLGRSREDWRTESVARATRVLNSFFGTLAYEAPAHWKLGTSPGGYLKTNNGVAAGIEALSDLLLFETTIKGGPLNDAEAASAVARYAKPIAEHFEKGGEGVQKFRSLLGAAGQRTAGLFMLDIASREYSEITTPALEAHRAKVDPAAVAAAKVIAERLEAQLRRVVLAELKNAHGDNWWRSGIPERTRTAVRRRQEKAPKETNLEDLLSPDELAVAARNHWSALRDRLAYPQSARGRAKQSAWLDVLARTLKGLRKRVPTISPDDVAILKAVVAQGK